MYRTLAAVLSVNGALVPTPLRNKDFASVFYRRPGMATFSTVTAAWSTVAVKADFCMHSKLAFEVVDEKNNSPNERWCRFIDV